MEGDGLMAVRASTSLAAITVSGPVSRFVCECSKIWELDFHGFGWHDEDVKQVTQIIQAGLMPKLEEIGLSGNNFGVPAAASLSKAILSGKSPHLRSLDLGGNHNMGDIGCEVHFAECLLGWIWDDRFWVQSNCRCSLPEVSYNTALA